MVYTYIYIYIYREREMYVYTEEVLARRARPAEARGEREVHGEADGYSMLYY